MFLGSLHMKVYDHSGVFGKDWTGGHVVCLLNDVSLPAFGGVLPSFSSVPKRLRAALTRSLRSLVDQWIDSGRGADGVDAPRTRSVYWLPASAAKPLCDVLLGWQRRHAAEMDVLPGGERVITMGKPKRSPAADDPLGLAYDPLPESEWEAGEIAIYWLQELLESPDSCRIGRCDNPECRRYYLRQRTIEKISRGTYCQRCTAAGSKRRVEAIRDEHKQQLVNLAAGVWERFKASRRFPRKSAWVAARMNRLLPLDMRVHSGGKWVTQNRKAIEAEVERRKHAKG
jgi:hypothetical protein